MDARLMVTRPDSSESNDDRLRDLVQQAAAGDGPAIDQLFLQFRLRLKRMVHLRLSRRLPERWDDS
jgi:hypothetical protein